MGSYHELHLHFLTLVFLCQIVETTHVVTMNDLETRMDGSRRVYIYIYQIIQIPVNTLMTHVC